MNQHLLSIVLFTPLAGLIVLLFLPSRNKNLIRLWANLVAFAGFLVSIPLVTQFDRGAGEFQSVGDPRAAERSRMAGAALDARDRAHRQARGLGQPLLSQSRAAPGLGDQHADGVPPGIHAARHDTPF